jgi:hypothetical protein
MLMMLHFPQNSEKNIKIKEVISFICFQSDRFQKKIHFYSCWTFLQLLGCKNAIDSKGGLTVRHG